MRDENEMIFLKLKTSIILFTKLYYIYIYIYVDKKLFWRKTTLEIYLTFIILLSKYHSHI